MSARFAALPPDAMQDRRLLEVDLAVLNDLGLHADIRTGWCFRAQKAMAEEIGVSRRTAQRSLDRLVEHGYLDREARVERGKGQKSNLYRVLFEIASRRGQLDMFEDLPELKPATKKARKSSSVTPPPRHARGVNDAPPASCAGGKWRTIERPLNEGGGVSCETPVRDRPKTDERPGPVPSHAAPGPVPTGKVDPGHLENRLVAAGGDGLDPMSLGLRVMTEPLGWIAAGCDLDADIVPTVAGLCLGRSDDRIKSWNYFAKAVGRARDRRLARGAVEHVPPEQPRPPASARAPRQKSVGDRVADYMSRMARGEDPFTHEETINVAANR